MMFTTNRIFIDSSILVEYRRGNKIELLDYLSQRLQYELCLSETVLSEYTFHTLALDGQKAPLTLKKAKQISTLLDQADLGPIFHEFTVLGNSNSVIDVFLRYMQEYNLLPNDALILATCKLHNINRLASYDSDFATACAGEGIQLIQSVADLTA